MRKRTGRQSPQAVFAGAVSHFWAARSSQSDSQTDRGTADTGTRGAVTGGRQMDGFVSTLEELIVAGGTPRGQIQVRKSNLVVPGFYRATKQWDLLVVGGGSLRAVLELKSQVGPSFGNNANNRAEEAIGSAEDLWTAYREEAYGARRPWLGYLFLLEDCDGSRGPVDVDEPHFPVLPEFSGASYARRYELLCRKLVLERKYDAACFLLSDRAKADDRPNYVEPAPDLAADRFVASLLAHLSVPC